MAAEVTAAVVATADDEAPDDATGVEAAAEDAGAELVLLPLPDEEPEPELDPEP